MNATDPSFLLPLLGVAAGTVLGYVARVNRFCTLSAFERLWYAGDSRGLRTWILAATIALIASQSAAALGLADLSLSFYLQPGFGLTGAVLGGVMFGLGMALVGTCGFGAIIRLGGGSLRAAVVLIVLGLSALAAQRGLLAPLRILLVDDLALDFSAAGSQSITQLLSHLTGTDLSLAVPVLASLGLLGWIFSDRAYRREGALIVSGSLVGLCITFGWLATTWASRNAFDPIQIEAASFVVPVGDTILQLVTYTGTLPDYGVGLLIGTFLGAALGAWRKRDGRWEACDDARELGRHFIGASLMGIGGVFAMGCTVGQGITAVSTLAISAPIVFASIALGARIGLAWLIEGSIRPLVPGLGRHAP
ncbi:YeeE/YedE family protein [Breoghania sp.]|uniref:YeeE/YedE family protein n=1 Tax=Breoghania sp. TaxID=2065378 RepID=UPI0029CA4086|nr:YeeE/YedE family protein [Breoghania sp.]